LEDTVRHGANETLRHKKEKKRKLSKKIKNQKQITKNKWWVPSSRCFRFVVIWSGRAADEALLVWLLVVVSEEAESVAGGAFPSSPGPAVLAAGSSAIAVFSSNGYSLRGEARRSSFQPENRS
jgi:hypothetical protein